MSVTEETDSDNVESKHEIDGLVRGLTPEREWDQRRTSRSRIWGVGE